MTHRTYKFELPYEIGSFTVGFGIGQLKAEGLFAKLPVDLQTRFDKAAETWQSVVITKQDCDEIDNDTWTKIADKLSLEWS